MGGWTSGSTIWLVLALLFALGGIACAHAEGGWGGFVWIDMTLAAFCLSGLAYCRIAAKWGWPHGLVVLSACLVLLAMWTWLQPLGWWFDTVGFGNQPFDSATWKQTDRRDYGITPPDPRGMMLRSLLRSGRLRGATKDEVMDLLGRPDPALLLAGAGEHWDYQIGWFTGFQMDPDFLVIAFDGGGRVKNWSIVQT